MVKLTKPTVTPTDTKCDFFVLLLIVAYLCTSWPVYMLFFNYILHKGDLALCLTYFIYQNEYLV